MIKEINIIFYKIKNLLFVKEKLDFRTLRIKKIIINKNNVCGNVEKFFYFSKGL